MGLNDKSKVKREGAHCGQLITEYVFFAMDRKHSSAKRRVENGSVIWHFELTVGQTVISDPPMVH